MPITPNQPIVNAGEMYVNGLEMIYLSAKEIAISPGACRDSKNINDIVLQDQIILNGTATGANGVDIAPFPGSGNKMYAVYVIADSTKYRPTAGVFVRTPLEYRFADPEPVLPFGYDMFRRVGWVMVETGNITPFSQFGSDQYRTIYYQEPVEFLEAANSTTYAGASPGEYAPDRETELYLDINFVANAATNVAEFAIGTGSANFTVRYATGVAARQRGSFWMPSQSTEDNIEIRYKVTSASDALTLGLIAYKDNLYPPAPST